MHRLVMHARTLVCAVLVVSAACSSKPERPVARRTVATPAGVVTPQPTFAHPLSGVTFSGSQPWKTRPALAIKVENSRPARPQSGLLEADVVYEELVEGGLTRFIAVYQSTDAHTVGPVRSARRTDAMVLASIGGLFAYAGGVGPVIDAVRSTDGIVDVGVDLAPDAYTRIGERRAPHNLYTSTAGLWRGRTGTPPASHFEFLPQGVARPAGAAGSSVEMTFYDEPVRYDYDPAAGIYRRLQGGAPHVVGDGAQVSASNVIVQIVSVTDSEITDVNGRASPESLVVGDGEVIVLSGGVSYRGRWERGSAASPTRFVDGAGVPIPLAPGRTWVELLPRGRPVTVR